MKRYCQRNKNVNNTTGESISHAWINSRHIKSQVGKKKLTWFLDNSNSLESVFVKDDIHCQ